MLNFIIVHTQFIQFEIFFNWCWLFKPQYFTNGGYEDIFSVCVYLYSIAWYIGYLSSSIEAAIGVLTAVILLFAELKPWVDRVITWKYIYLLLHRQLYLRYAYLSDKYHIKCQIDNWIQYTLFNLCSSFLVSAISFNCFVDVSALCTIFI